jgi:hypothetical protein
MGKQSRTGIRRSGSFVQCENDVEARLQLGLELRFDTLRSVSRRIYQLKYC